MMLDLFLTLNLQAVHILHHNTLSSSVVPFMKHKNDVNQHNNCVFSTYIGLQLCINTITSDYYNLACGANIATSAKLAIYVLRPK